MKYLKFVFITLPNLPFILILAFYVIYRIISCIDFQVKRIEREIEQLKQSAKK